jgi:hypothetical protein
MITSHIKGLIFRSGLFLIIRRGVLWGNFVAGDRIIAISLRGINVFRLEQADEEVKNNYRLK